MSTPNLENAQDFFDNTRMLFEMKSFWNLTSKVLGAQALFPAALEEPEIPSTTPRRIATSPRGSHGRRFNVNL